MRVGGFLKGGKSRERGNAIYMGLITYISYFCGPAVIPPLLHCCDCIFGRGYYYTLHLRWVPKLRGPDASNNKLLSCHVAIVMWQFSVHKVL